MGAGIHLKLFALCLQLGSECCGLGDGSLLELWQWQQTHKHDTQRVGA